MGLFQFARRRRDQEEPITIGYRSNSLASFHGQPAMSPFIHCARCHMPFPDRAEQLLVGVRKKKNEEKKMRLVLVEAVH